MVNIKLKTPSQTLFGCVVFGRLQCGLTRGFFAGSIYDKDGFG